jgi:hypothetical protein
MLFQNWRRTLDILASALVIFLSVWVYEISNAIVLAAQGFSISFNVAGPVPLGVAGSSWVTLSPWTKLLQIAIAIGLLLPIGVVFTKKRLHFAVALLISTIAIYAASAYWEMLSSLTVIPLAIHTGIYVAVTGTLTLALLWNLSRPLDLWYRPESPVGSRTSTNPPHVANASVSQS